MRHCLKKKKKVLQQPGMNHLHVYGNKDKNDSRLLVRVNASQKTVEQNLIELKEAKQKLAT
jgi:hypothetical protein